MFSVVENAINNRLNVFIYGHEGIIRITFLNICNKIENFTYEPYSFIFSLS